MANKKTRREFMGIVGTAGLGLASGTLLADQAPAHGAESWLTHSPGMETKPGSADLIVFNAKVYTVDDAMPKAQAFAVRGDRFLAVGRNQDIRGLKGQRTRMVDAQQHTIIPGCIDCHNHVAGNEILYSTLVGNPYTIEFFTIDRIIATLRAAAEKTPPDTWVVGTFFDDTKTKPNRELNIHDLDKASTDRPIVVHDRGGHTAFYNSKAFQMAGVTKNTPNPFGGTFGRFPNGDLDGRVTDLAMQVFDKVGKHPSYSPAETLQRDRDALAYMSKKFVQYGLTGVCHQGGDLTALQQVRQRGELLHRVSYEASGKVLDAMIDAGIQTGFGDEWMRFGATLEHTIDGSFSERTMSLSMGYPGNRSYHGNIRMTQPDLNAWVEKIHQARIQPNCHANGDIAIDMYLTALERLHLDPKDDMRPKFTHCTLINPTILRRMKALNAVPALFNTYAYYNADKFHFYGKEIMKNCLAFRSLQETGIVAAGGSDFPPGPFDPRMAIQGIVTRKGFNGEVWGANQAVSVDEAIRIETINGAYDTHEEKIKGSITPGKLADYVVWSEDPHTIDPDKIINIQIVSTAVGGETRYEA